METNKFDLIPSLETYWLNVPVQTSPRLKRPAFKMGYQKVNAYKIHWRTVGLQCLFSVFPFFVFFDLISFFPSKKKEKKKSQQVFGL